MRAAQEVSPAHGALAGGLDFIQDQTALGGLYRGQMIDQAAGARISAGWAGRDMRAVHLERAALPIKERARPRIKGAHAPRQRVGGLGEV